jgi:DNA-binding NarL/FixJ family response regulator
VYLLSESRVHREAIARVLADEQLLVVGAGAPDGAALQAIVESQVETLILDGWSPPLAALARQLPQPPIKLLALGVPEEEAQVLACAKAGVGGYVDRDAPASAVAQAVGDLARGRFPCPPGIAAILFRHFAALGGRAPVDGAQLTQREQEILAFIDRGFTNREIARALSIELPTVKNHVHNILEKLRVRRRGAAAAKVRAAGA